MRTRRIRMVFIMLPIVLALLLLCDALVYQAVALAFGIHNTLTLLLIAIALIFLTASFIASTILGNYYYNTFTRAYYTISAIWLGTFFYLLLASLLYGIAITISLSMVVIGEPLIIAPVLLSIYGLIHARRIVTKAVTVTLRDLPSSWSGKRITFVSDLHLGQLHGAAFATRVTAAIMALAPDMIVIGGDLFDGTTAPDAAMLAAPLAKLSAPHGVYYITGNHEEYGDIEQFLAAVKGAGMRILMDEMVMADGLQIIGVDYHQASDAARFKEILARAAIDRSKPSILFKHEPSDLPIAEAAGISLQLSGHTHRGQIWPLEYLARMRYGTSFYGLTRHGALQVLTSSGVGSWGPPQRVGTNSEIVLITLR